MILTRSNHDCDLCISFNTSTKLKVKLFNSSFIATSWKENLPA